MEDILMPRHLVATSLKSRAQAGAQWDLESTSVWTAKLLITQMMIIIPEEAWAKEVWPETTNTQDLPEK